MNISREQGIFAAIIVAVVLAVGMGAYLWQHQDPYKNLVTSLEVQSDEATRALAQQRIATAQAALQAAKTAGEQILPDSYNAIASDALLLGDLILARESLETSLSINSLDGTVWSSYGYTLYLMQDYENAKNAYLRAVEITPIEATYRDAVRILEDFFPEEQEKIKALYKDSVDVLGQRMFNMRGLGEWYASAGECSQAKAHFAVAEDLATSEDVRTQVEEEGKEALSACKAMGSDAQTK